MQTSRPVFEAVLSAANMVHNVNTVVFGQTETTSVESLWLVIQMLQYIRWLFGQSLTKKQICGWKQWYQSCNGDSFNRDKFKDTLLASVSEYGCLTLTLPGVQLIIQE